MKRSATRGSDGFSPAASPTPGDPPAGLGDRDGPAALPHGVVVRPRRAARALTVRRATPADLPVVVSLRLSLLQEHGHNPLYGRLRRDARRRAERIFAAQLADDEEVAFLAEFGGQTVGILRCMIGHGSPLLYPASYGYIASVYVEPAGRRRGVLRVLMAAAEQWCEERGLNELRLHNAADNPTANAAWAALGFEVVEVLRVRAIRTNGEWGTRAGSREQGAGTASGRSSER